MVALRSAAVPVEPGEVDSDDVTAAVYGLSPGAAENGRGAAAAVAAVPWIRTVTTTTTPTSLSEVTVAPLPAATRRADLAGIACHRGAERRGISCALRSGPDHHPAPQMGNARCEEADQGEHDSRQRNDLTVLSFEFGRTSGPSHSGFANRLASSPLLRLAAAQPHRSHLTFEFGRTSGPSHSGFANRLASSPLLRLAARACRSSHGWFVPRGTRNQTFAGRGS